MSIKVMTAVWEESTQQGSALLLMLALADHANDDGVCWPSIERLAHRTRLTDRQVQRIVERVVGSGELYVLHSAGRSYANLYLVTIGHTARTLTAVLTRRFELKPDEARQMSFAILARRNGEKVTPVSPFASEKVTSSAEKVTSRAEKGDTSVTLTVINPQLTTTEIEDTTNVDQEALRAAETWEQARNLIRLELPRSTFDERLRDTIGISAGDDAFEIQCVTQDQADFLTRRLHAKVANALAEIIGRPVTVAFTARQAPRLLH